MTLSKRDAEALHGSVLYRIWMGLCAVYGGSFLHRALAVSGDWCSRQIENSAVLGVLCREGALARAWGGSLTCRALTALANLPGWLLHKLYQAFQPAFNGSFFARLAFRLGDETAVAESWLVMLLWVIPFERWNNAYSMLAFALLLAMFYIRSMYRRKARLDVAAVGPYTAAMFAAAALGVVFSMYPGLSTRFLMYHAVCLLCVLVTASAVRDTVDLKRLAAAGGFVVLVSSLYAVYQRIQGVEVKASYVDLTLNEGMPGRVDSFFDNPNTFAQVLILLLPLVLALALCSRRLWLRGAALGVFAVGSAALGMTYSRASWIGFACSLAVLVFLWRPSLIPAFALACVLAIPFLPETIFNRILTITNTSDSSTASRVPLYRATLELIRSSPITGAGLGTAAVQKYINVQNLYHARAPYVHAHNIYLQVWAEAGLLGVVSFVGCMLLNIKNAARTVRHCSDSAARTITCAGASALCGAMVCGLADYLWNYPRVMSIFWFVFALTIAGTKLCRRPSGSWQA